MLDARQHALVNEALEKARAGDGVHYASTFNHSAMAYQVSDAIQWSLHDRALRCIGKGKEAVDER